MSKMMALMAYTTSRSRRSGSRRVGIVFLRLGGTPLQGIGERRVGRDRADAPAFEALGEQAAIADRHLVPQHLVALAEQQLLALLWVVGRDGVAQQLGHGLELLGQLGARRHVVMHRSLLAVFVDVAGQALGGTELHARRSPCLA